MDDHVIPTTEPASETDTINQTTPRQIETQPGTIAYYIWLISPWMTCFIGVPLNIANMTLMVRSRVVTSRVVYVTLLSFIDSLALVHKLIMSHYPTLHILASPTFCKYMVFMVEFLTQFSSWILVLLCLERAVVVRSPFSRLTVLNTRRSLVYVCSTGMVLTVANVHQLFTITSTITSAGNVHCINDKKLYEHLKRYWYIIKALLSVYLPFIFLFASNIVIIVCLFRRRKPEGKHSSSKTSVYRNLSNNMHSESENSPPSSLKIPAKRPSNHISPIHKVGTYTNTNVCSNNGAGNVDKPQNTEKKLLGSKDEKNYFSIRKYETKKQYTNTFGRSDTVNCRTTNGNVPESHVLVILKKGGTRSSTKRLEGDASVWRRRGQMGSISDHSNKTIRRNRLLVIQHEPSVRKLKFHNKSSRKSMNRNLFVDPQSNTAVTNNATRQNNEVMTSGHGHKRRVLKKTKGIFKRQLSKTTKCILTASTVFFVLNIPFCLCILYAQLFMNKGIISLKFQLLATTASALRDLNHVVNFFIYCNIKNVTFCGVFKKVIRKLMHYF